MGCVWEACGDGWRQQVIPASGLDVAGARVLGLSAGALLVIGPGVWARVNGEPAPGGVRVLGHRDEVFIAGVRLIFSAQAAAEVVPFRVPEEGRAPTCPICRGPVRAGMQAVRCPGCGRWFHQAEAAAARPAKPCWTYAPTCRFCNHPTALDGATVWRPGQEESDV